MQGSSFLIVDIMSPLSSDPCYCRHAGHVEWGSVIIVVIMSIVVSGSLLLQTCSTL